jgi:hypothetical protein
VEARKVGTVVKEKDGRYRVRIRRKVRGAIIDKSARFERLTDARKWDQQIEAEITAGKFFKTIEAEQHTLNDVLERYKQHLGLENPRRLKTVTHLLEWWGAKLGHHLLADLTQAVIAKVMDDLRMETVPNRKKGLKYTNATVNRYKSALQSALNMAVSPWCWLEDNPAKKMKNLKEPPGRDRFLNKDELTALLDQCQISENPYLYSIVVIALSSGARREEIRTIAANAAIEAEFKASRAHIMKMLRDLMDRKGYIAAVAWGERFAEVEDAEFQELYGKARRLNGMQQTEMKQKMDAKQVRLNSLQNINVSVEGTHAITYCQNLVRAELKVPEQAKFPKDTDVQVTGTNERFIVHSFVDAPNSFNAITRTPYFCRLYYNGGGRSGWNIEEFRVGE